MMALQVEMPGASPSYTPSLHSLHLTSASFEDLATVPRGCHLLGSDIDPNQESNEEYVFDSDDRCCRGETIDLPLTFKDPWDTTEKMTPSALKLESVGPLDDDGHIYVPPSPKPTVPLSKLDVQRSDADPRPFHRWMRTLHRRASHRPDCGIEGSASSWQLPMTKDRLGQLRGSSGHRKSSSGSSIGFVTGVKSASISLASVSAVTKSRRHNGRSRGSRTDCSSRASFAGPRMSEDDAGGETNLAADGAATERALQRRRILEELISTEESYIGDIRFLTNAYITLLASLPTLPIGLRSSINRNLTAIVELHEEILGDLHRIIPYSEYTQLDLTNGGVAQPKPGHIRWKSLDSVPENETRKSGWLQDVPGMVADPQVAEEVAKVFSKKMNRFFIYKEYGAKYESMIKDVASAHRTMPQWATYQKGLEVLASSVSSANRHIDLSKKSLTISDLLVKPIQRVCKYPLLFAELLKYTPVGDCANSHMEVEDALLRLREATAEINRATDDARIKLALEKTWILQDRLVFANQRLDAASKNRIRSFGHINMCGALYVCWQTTEGVTGQYLVCLLYKEVLCLAVAGRVDQIYTILACINLGGVRVEEVDNGRGLQCHTAPFSWKLVFECDHQLYEIIMTACTPKEEMEWRTRLTRSTTERQEQQKDPNLYSSVSLDMRSLGTVFGKPGTMARRISIHRATTVGPKQPPCQVILRNTSVVKDTAPTTATSPATINRSQSLLTTNARVPILAPSRGERARLEALLADVWSREILPFPGMTTRSRSEHLVRTSASSMMRRLSVASITSTFTKRSGSFASAGKVSTEDDSPSSDDPTYHSQTTKSSRESSITSRRNSMGEADDKLTRLPVIQDVTERQSSSTSATILARDTGGSVKTAIPAAETAKTTDSASPSETAAAASLILTMSQTGSNSRRSRQATRAAKKLAVAIGEKESRAKQLGAEARRSSRSPGKWVKVNVLNRDVMVQGIRSLFR